MVRCGETGGAPPSAVGGLPHTVHTAVAVCRANRPPLSPSQPPAPDAAQPAHGTGVIRERSGAEQTLDPHISDNCALHNNLTGAGQVSDMFVKPLESGDNPVSSEFCLLRSCALFVRP